MKKHDNRTAQDGMEWLTESLGHMPHIPNEREQLSVLRDSLTDVKAVTIFGAGSGGRRTYRVLRERGVEVGGFIDNFATGDVDGIPIYSPKDAPEGDEPIILASTWFVDVYRQLTENDPRYANRRVIPVPDCAFITMTIFDDMVGWPFYDAFRKRLDDFKRVFELWEDERSRQTFARIVAYRLSFFAPQNLLSSDLPCPPDVYEQTARPVPALPEGLGEDVRGAIANTFAHPHYLLDGFMEPKDGDIVLDGGAWEGDTAYWYADFCKPSGQVYAFEPSPFNYANMVRNVELMHAASLITPVQQGLSDAPGSAAWSDMTAAGTCSRIDDSAQETQSIPLTSVDQFVQERGLSRVDIIKTDLEGADFDALRGARETIQAFSPDLAISMYHKADHLVDIPLWIHEHFPHYRMRISHNHVGVNESICMASARGDA